jgi:hypothetical protein
MRARLAFFGPLIVSCSLAAACGPGTDSVANTPGGGAQTGAGGAGSGNGGSGQGGGVVGTGGHHAGGGGGVTTGAGGGGECKAPKADCNKNPKDGCETDLSTDPANCGACGDACPQGANATAGCAAGKCTVVCDAGFLDCNKDPKDGCETDGATDAKNCGACAAACPSGPNAPAACEKSKCTLSCAAGTGDCDGDPKNGCEANLFADPNNCGACGTSCNGAQCVQGACACASETQTAQLVPLDLYIMLDQSGSMSDTVAGGGTKWSAVTTALKSFFADPKSAGISAGIQYFPLQAGGQPPPFCQNNADCGAFGPCLFGSCFGGQGGGDSCTAADYAKPDVEIALLAAAQVSALDASIAKHGPTTNTPTAPALQGAIQHAAAWEVANPSHVTVVVFATDGDPTECDPQDIPSIKAIAAAGVAGKPSIETFVIGVGPSLQALNDIASGGGTGQAFLVDTGANVVQQFEAALAAIQKSAIGCEYGIPQPKQGQLDYQKVNVQYTPGNGGAPQLFPNVKDKAACPNTGGWYYDDDANPTKIILCDASCATVSADAKAKVDVLLGCATQHQ